MVDNLKQKTFRAFAWDLTGKLADQGIGFFISIFLARLLAPEDFGLLAMAMVVISLAHVLIDSGLGTSLIQRKTLTDAHYGSVFFFNILVGSFLTIVFFLFAGTVADFYNRPELKPILQALSFNFFINSFCQVQRAWLTKQVKFEILTKASIVSMIVGGAFGVALAYFGYGVWALVVQSLLSGIVANLYISFFTGWRPKLVYRWVALKELWSFGFRMFLSGILNTLISQVDSLIIGKIFTPATLGFYHRAKSLNQFIVKYSAGSLMPVLFPVLSSVQDDNERYKQIVFKAFHVLNFVTFLMLGVLYLTSEDIIVILFSEKWLPSVGYFKILLLGGYGYPLSVLLVNVLMSKGNSKGFLRLEIYKQSVVVINLIIGFSIGLNAFLYGLAVVTVFGVFLNILYAANEMKIRIYVFLEIIFIYSFLSVGLVLTLYLFESYIPICNHLLHGIFHSLVFIFSFIGFSFLFKFKGLKYIYVELEPVLRNYVWRKK